MPLYMKMPQNVNETMRHLKFCYISILTNLLFSLKILPIERSSLTVKVRKKIIDQILGCISFCFEIPAHLGHLFA